MEDDVIGVLLDSQKHDVFQVIQKEGFDPAHFEWEHTKDASKLSYKGSRYYCDFREINHPPSTFAINISPAQARVRQHLRFDSFARTLTGVASWLTFLRRELTTPNLWAEIAREQELSSAATSQSEAHITPDEVEKVAQAVDEIKQFLLATTEIGAEHRRFVEDKLNYLKSAALRQDRKAWMHTAIGVLMSIVIEAALPPEKARELFRMAGRLFTGVFQALSDPAAFVQGLLQ
ncbi:MAG: hypothetical protein WD847_09045 [Pirellulales bacterium]